MTDSQRGRSPEETRAAAALLSGALGPLGSAGPCPSAEDLGAFIDGRGTAAERATIAAHVERCEVCYAIVSGVVDLAAEFSNVLPTPLPNTSSPSTFRDWFARHRLVTVSTLATAASLALIVWTTVKLNRAADPLQAALQRLDHSLGEYRPIGAQLTGASYRPVGPATRAATPATEAPLEVRELANAVERAAVGAASATRAHALAKMYLVSGRPDRAVDAIAPLVSASRDPGFLSDTAAAYLSRAREGDYAQALDAAARAVEIDPRFAPAWFNLGLASEALGQYPLAAKAWDRVIELDPASGWAREALAKKANAPKRQSWRSQDEGEFRAAVERGDDEAAGRVAERSPADARALFEQSILTAVVKQWSSGDRLALAAAVARPEAAGRAFGRLSADRWPLEVALQLREIVNRGDAAAGRAACIPALLDAIRLRSAGKWAEAADRLSASEPCRVAVPPALAADASFIRLRQATFGDVPLPALARLARQSAELARAAGTREYFALQGRALRLEALLLTRQAKYVDGLDRYRAAGAAFHRANDREAEAVIPALVAETDEFLGANEAAWRERSRALKEMHAIALPQSRFNVYTDVIRALVDQSLYAAALSMLDTALADMDGQGDVSLLLLASRAALLARRDRLDDARSDVRAAFSLLARTGASAPMEDFRRNVQKSQAIVTLRADPAGAIEGLTRLIETSDPASNAFEAAELFFLRATAYARQSDVNRADQDFRHGFDLVERRQLNLPDYLQPAAFDRTWAAMAEAIRLHAVTQNDPWGALTFAERARAASLTARISNRPFEGAEEFRRKLPPDVAVIFLSALDDAVLSWGMTTNAVSFHLEPIAYGDLADLARRFRSTLESAPREAFEPIARQLHQMILAPHGDLLSHASTVVLVPDGPLLAAPFAALVGPNGRFLIEERAVLVAPNLRLLRTLSSRQRNRPVRSAVAFGNPSLGPNLPWALRPLTGAENEARKVAEAYVGTALVGAAATKPAFLDALRRYDVVHFAGHAVVNTDRTESSSLVLAPSVGDSGVLGPKEIIERVAIPPGALVVLAACDTAEGAVFRGEGLMGLVRPFVAAGAANVVANLWPVEDETAVEFSAAFHREVRAGAPPGRALQRVQADFASRKLPARSWAGWVVVGGFL